MYKKPIILEVIQLVGTSLSAIAAFKIAKDTHDEIKKKKAKNQSQK